jgi:hypothetical protein
MMHRVAKQRLSCFIVERIKVAGLRACRSLKHLPATGAVSFLQLKLQQVSYGSMWQQLLARALGDGDSAFKSDVVAWDVNTDQLETGSYSFCSSSVLEWSMIRVTQALWLD